MKWPLPARTDMYYVFLTLYIQPIWSNTEYFSCTDHDEEAGVSDCGFLLHDADPSTYGWNREKCWRIHWKEGNYIYCMLINFVLFDFLLTNKIVYYKELPYFSN